MLFPRFAESTFLVLLQQESRDGIFLYTVFTSSIILYNYLIRFLFFSVPFHIHPLLPCPTARRLNLGQRLPVVHSFFEHHYW